MAKTQEQLLEESITHFRMGKSVRECEKITGINYKKIEREAKKRGHEKGELSQLTSSMTRDRAEFVTLPVTVQDVITKEVDERTRHIEFFNNAAITNVKQAMAEPCENQNDYRARAETINKGREAVLGKTPDTAIQVNTQINEIRRVIVKP